MECPKKKYERCLKKRCPYYKTCDYYRLWLKGFLLGHFIGDDNVVD